MPSIELTEHRPTLLPRETLTEDQGATLFKQYGQYVDVLFPSPATGNRWQLMFRGWIGAIRLDRSTELLITPKVPLANLGRMLRYAFELPVDVFPGIVDGSSLTDLYGQLVRALAREAFRLARQGLHQEYRPQTRSGPVIKGRIEVADAARRPGSVTMPCTTSERNVDVLENQLVLAAIESALRADLCSRGCQAVLRQAYRQLGHGVRLVAFDPNALPSIGYTRLTERYRPAHALARLILSSRGSADIGDRTTVPFLISMPRLFELFVARWLQSHLPNGMRVATQKHWRVGSPNGLDFYLDVALRDEATGRTLCVLDTKYKDYPYPTTSDVAQVAYYALLEDCALAGLVTPMAVGEWQANSGGMHVFRSGFDVGDDIDRAGQRFLEDLFSRVERSRERRVPHQLSVA